MRTRAPSISRLIAAILALVASPALIALDDGPTSKPVDLKPLPAAKMVIEKMITAQGGREAMQKITSRVMTGELEMIGQGMKAKFTTYTGGEQKFRESMTMEGFGSFDQGVSGDVAWALDPFQGARVLEGVEKSLSERGAHLNPILHVESDYKTMSTIGREEIDGKKYLKLELVSHDGQSETWFVDEATHLRFRTESVIEAPMVGKIKVKFDETDYRKVDDLLIAHRTFIDQGVQKITIRATKIEHNTEIDPALFAIPAEVQKLIDKQKEREKEKEKEPATGGTPAGPGR